jgi:hypothetical protein
MWSAPRFSATFALACAVAMPSRVRAEEDGSAFAVEILACA